MSKKTRITSDKFTVSSYQLLLSKKTPLEAKVLITGQKIGPPSKRIVLNQKDLKVLAAEIAYQSKKGQEQKMVARINHHKKFEQIRLHTADTLFPGQYIIKLKFRYLIKVSGRKKLRQILPSIDEPDQLQDYAVSYIDE